MVMGAAALACGFADVFRPAGPEAVTITYVGDTIHVECEVTEARLSESLVRSTAIEGAAQYGELLEAVNIAYSEQTERLEPAERAKILFPASLTNYLDQHIGEHPRRHLGEVAVDR